jgi:hypothetical protein
MNALSGCADIQPIWASRSPVSLAIPAESLKTRADVEKHDVQANSRYGLTLSVPLAEGLTRHAATLKHVHATNRALLKSSMKASDAWSYAESETSMRLASDAVNQNPAKSARPTETR